MSAAMYRQGDVLIVPVSEEALPERVEDLPREARVRGASEL